MLLLRILLIQFLALAFGLASLCPLAAQTLDIEQIKAIASAANLDAEPVVPIAKMDGAYSTGNILFLRLQDGNADFIRQYDVVNEVFGLSLTGKKLTATLKQGPFSWKVSSSDPNAVVGAIRFRSRFVFAPSSPTVDVYAGAVNRFRACDAEFSSGTDKLQFEPLAYKNTVGYWVNPKDSPHWRFMVSTPGKFRVRILQGCGKGQGGSEITLRFGKTSLPYQVRETGHFQAFRWFDVGDVELKATKSNKLEVIVDKLAKNAVMDIREIRLEPIPKERTVPGKPNVVIFYADDQGTLDANCFGSRDLHTPNIDGLAQQGVRFTQAYAHTVCCPSRAMLMTGRVPQRSNVNNWTQGNAKSKPGRNMDLEEKTIAEYLKEAGYQTALFGKWHLGAAPTHGPTKQGFDQFFGLRGGFIDNFNHHFLHGNGFHDLYEGTREVFRGGEYFPDLVTRRSIKFIEKSSEAPFLLCVPFNIPHYPEQADAVFEQRYLRLKQPRKSYAKTVSTTDERIGQILRKLDELRLRQNTIVIFMSDNGHSAEDYSIRTDKHTSGMSKGSNYGANGGGGNTGKWRGHKGTFFEGGIRVPAIISFPAKIPAGQVRNQIMTACDWLPTILDLCGIDQPSATDSKRQFDGQSLLPMINDNAQTHHKVVHWQWQNKWAVRKGNWKLVGAPNKTELYSLADDPPESIDHAKEKPAVLKELRRLHDQWQQRIK